MNNLRAEIQTLERYLLWLHSAKLTPSTNSCNVVSTDSLHTMEDSEVNDIIRDDIQVMYRNLL